jgi:hypothetical protein
MADKEQKDMVHGYEVQRAIVFENNRGFAFAENPEAVSPYVTWMFTEEENGTRNYYWGHYASNKDAAIRDYEFRVSEYQKDYGQHEKGAYKYYSTQRPVDIGTFPKTENGPIYHINFDTREAVEMGRVQAWGYLVYDAPLTEKQITDYELRAAPDNPDVKAVMREQAQTVGAWEEKHGLPTVNRYTARWLGTDEFIHTPSISPEQMAKRYDYAKEELSRAAPKRISEQLAEAAKQVERGTDAPAKKQNKSHEDR